MDTEHIITVMLRHYNYNILCGYYTVVSDYHHCLEWFYLDCTQEVVFKL